MPPNAKCAYFNSLQYLKKGLHKHKEKLELFGTPDVSSPLPEITGKQQHSEKSLLKGQYIGCIDDNYASEESYGCLNIHATLVMARHLKTQFNLTILGFDTVVETCSGNHFIVDLNYFPSCSGIEGVEPSIKSAVVDRIFTHKNCNLLPSWKDEGDRIVA